MRTFKSAEKILSVDDSLGNASKEKRAVGQHRLGTKADVVAMEGIERIERKTSKNEYRLEKKVERG